MADDPLLEALRRLTGQPDAEFRGEQRVAIEALVNDRSRVLVVQRTGWGKSAVYFLTTHLLRQQGLGPTLLISPLLALMRNQIDAAQRLGLRCQTINSASDTTVAELEDQLHRDEVDLLLISPERLANPDFAAKIMPLVSRRPGLMVIDEVHCISDWGHDFRPDYRRIGRIIDRLAGSGVPILGCTATANDRVVDDVAAQLGSQLTTFRGPLARDGLALHAIRLDRQAERLAWLGETIPRLDGSGIVYCLTTRDADAVADWLRKRGITALPYHAGMPTEARLEAESKLQSNDIKALVATTALGMGYDKPDLSFVVHFQSPGSPVAYYQQVGRAGRALDASTGVLLRGLEDDDIQNYFIENAFAAEHLVNDVVHAFDQAVEQTGGPISLARLQSILNIRVGRLELVAKQLDVDGIVERVGPTTYQRTPQPWEYPATRIDQVTNARRAEQQAMLDYFHSTGCRMRYVAELLDDPAPADCGMCDNCVGPSMERELPVELVAEAEQFLRRRPLTVDPRLQGVPKGERTEQGRALAVWGDGGWGRLVRQGRQTDGVFAAELLDAAAELVADWGPEPAPEWVTCVPSFRQPELVPRFAEQLAARLGLPFVAAVGKREERAPQREQQNSAHQRQNIEGAFEVVAAHPTGPVLLVDDLVDSRWTLTDIGRALRRDGVELVHPLVLASATGRS